MNTMIIRNAIMHVDRDTVFGDEEIREFWQNAVIRQIGMEVVNQYHGDGDLENPEYDIVAAGAHEVAKRIASDANETGLHHYSYREVSDILAAINVNIPEVSDVASFADNPEEHGPGESMCLDDLIGSLTAVKDQVDEREAVKYPIDETEHAYEWSDVIELNAVIEVTIDTIDSRADDYAAGRE